MCLIVEATLPVSQFALHGTLTEVPDAQFEIMRTAAGGADNPIPFLWGTTDEDVSLPEVLREDPSTKTVEVMSELDGEYLLRIEWQARTRVIMHILEENATIIDAVGKNDTWWFRLLFPEQESVSSTFEFWEGYDIDLELKRVPQPSGSFRRGQLGLTEKQYEMIMSAYDKGYYAVPRGTNLKELARQLDISHQALSERLRRGHETLVANMLHPEMEASH